MFLILPLCPLRASIMSLHLDTPTYAGMFVLLCLEMSRHKPNRYCQNKLETIVVISIELGIHTIFLTSYRLKI